MKRILCILSLIALVFSSCKHHEDLPDPDNGKARRTVIVYIMAENSLNEYVENDSIEIAEGARDIPDSVNFIVYKDDVKLPIIYTVSKKEGFRAWKKFTFDHDSADSITMRNTFGLIARNFPAKHYGLVLWSHGSGWVSRTEKIRKKRTIGVDNNHNGTDNSGTRMNISELRWAIDNNFHPDYILFDACFMQSIEVAFELRNSTDYTIGSPAEIPGDGAPYHKIMRSLCSGDAKDIADSYFNFYEHSDGVALSVVNCKELDYLAQQSTPYIQKIWKDGISVNTSGIQFYGPYCDEFSWVPEPFDMRGTMHKFLSEEDYTTWNQALEQVLVFQKSTDDWSTSFEAGKHNRLTDRTYYCGLGMFIPSQKYSRHYWNAMFRDTEWYKAAGWEGTGW